MNIKKIGFGGGCHWCTEAYFQSLKGVEKTEQGWISAAAPHDMFSEAVIIHYNSVVIPLQTLIEIHLHTHASTKNHSFRGKYRSAVYVFDGNVNEAQHLIDNCRVDFDEPIITTALLFSQFRLNKEDQRDYYQKNRTGVFCERYIHPKLQMLEKKYVAYYKPI